MTAFRREKDFVFVDYLYPHHCAKLIASLFLGATEHVAEKGVPAKISERILVIHLIFSKSYSKLFTQIACGRQRPRE